MEEDEDIFPKQPASPTTVSPLEKHPQQLARVLFAVGQVALLQLFHLDVSIFSEMKRRHRVKEEEKEKKGMKKAGSSRRNAVEESASKTTSKQVSSGVGWGGLFHDTLL